MGNAPHRNEHAARLGESCHEQRRDRIYSECCRHSHLAAVGHENDILYYRYDQFRSGDLRLRWTAEPEFSNGKSVQWQHLGKYSALFLYRLHYVDQRQTLVQRRRRIAFWSFSIRRRRRREQLERLC